MTVWHKDDIKMSRKGAGKRDKKRCSVTKEKTKDDEG